MSYFFYLDTFIQTQGYKITSSKEAQANKSPKSRDEDVDKNIQTQRCKM